MANVWRGREITNSLTPLGDHGGAMMTLAITELVMQILCAIHGAALGRPRLWRWVVLGVPVVGWLAYLAMEIWRGLIRRGRDRMLEDGGADGRPPVAGETRRELLARAEARLRNGDADGAIELFGAALGRSDRHDPETLLGLARAYFADGDFGYCLQTLEALRRVDPGFEAGPCQSLAVRCRERLGQRRVA
jgi:hypothetical protein